MITVKSPGPLTGVPAKRVLTEREEQLRRIAEELAWWDHDVRPPKIETPAPRSAWDIIRNPEL